MLNNEKIAEAQEDLYRIKMQSLFPELSDDLTDLDLGSTHKKLGYQI